ncbi:hypothetical protein ACWCWD_29320 [Streptomyces sp. NPDC001493]
MASINYPYPDPKNDAERDANRQAADDYQRQEEEADTLLRLAEDLTPIAPELLVEQVRLDLAAAGLYVVPLGQCTTDEDQGGVVVCLDDDGQVVVDWLPHARLDRQALDMVDAGRTDHEAVIRYETVRAAMNTALGTVLTGLGYTTRRPFGYGHIIEQTSAARP